tara:strand:- start:402 stop:1535 length:1134 start_codon:yes stop_codon:yes gene_type:complete
MKNIFLVSIFSIFFASNLLAHKSPQFDSKSNCTKKRSMLSAISKVKGYGGGEIIKFNSYTGFDQRTVLINGHLNNPIEITGYLRLPEGTSKVPIVIYTHSSGGPGDYIWDDFVYHAAQNLLKEGIGVMYIDNFCPRGARSTWRDQSKVPLINGAIDAMMALKVLQSHPRSNGKFGTTGHSRGGTNSFYLADVKFTSKFIKGTKGFDAILPEAAECRMAGFFREPELTSNTTLLVVHGGADDYTLAKYCKEHAERIKAPPGKVKIDVKEGWYHVWHAGKKPWREKMAMTLHDCPDVYIDNNGKVINPIWKEWLIEKYKLFPSEEAWYEAAQNKPRKTFKTIFKAMKKEKCLSKGVTIGGNNMDVYMPQFINFFKDNLL